MSHKYDIYGHQLVDNGDKRLERRINRKANEYYKVRNDEANSAKALALRTDILTLVSRYFKVVGQGMGSSNQLDDSLIDALIECLDKHDPEKGPYTHYIRFKYKLIRASAGKKEAKIHDHLVDLDSSEAGQLEIPDNSEEVSEQSYAKSQIRLNAAIAEFVSLVIAFLDHAPDKNHSSNAKLYLKMNFTERTTYSVKVQPVFDYCMPFVLEQKRIFATIENDFLNVYMADVCDTIRMLWDTDLKPGFGEIIKLDDPRLQQSRPPAPWKLETRVHLDYLGSKGITVTAAVVSQHRKKFRDLQKQLTTFN